MKTNDQFVGKVESRFQFIATLAIFFPTLVYSLSKFAGRLEEEANKTVLDLSITIALYLTGYLLFLFLKDRIEPKWLRWVNGLLVLAIIPFVALTFFIAIKGNGPINQTEGYALVSLIGLLYGMSMVIALFVFVFGLIVPEVKFIIDAIKKRGGKKRR